MQYPTFAVTADGENVIVDKYDRNRFLLVKIRRDGWKVRQLLSAEELNFVLKKECRA